MKSISILTCILILSATISCNDEQPSSGNNGFIQLTALRVGTVSLLSDDIDECPVDLPIVFSFSTSIKPETVERNFSLTDDEGTVLEVDYSYLDDNRTISVLPQSDLYQNSNYTVTLGEGIRGVNDEAFPGLIKVFKTINPPLEVESVWIDEQLVNPDIRIKNVDVNSSFTIQFSQPIDVEALEGEVYIFSSGGNVTPTATLLKDSVINFQIPNPGLKHYSNYRFYLSPTIKYEDRDFEGYEFEFFTKLDSTLKFPEISDDELLTKVQEQTFKYFWDFGHPTSGLARERNTSGETVTIGGSGFGIMSIIVGIERGFVTRQEGIDRIEKMVTFLKDKADRFHGVWSHWLNGTSGKAIPFSSNDDGGDLVETAFMAQGLMTVRQYLDNTNAQELGIITDINQLLDEIEWDWYTQDDQSVLYWHWSPNFGWEKNHKITGWNEALIVYVLAASSTTHSIDPEVYTDGWSRSGSMVNTAGSSYYNYTLPLRSDRGGPLFFAHYSFLGLDPRNLSDQYADYWEQNRIHTLINQAYCKANPKNYIGYSDYCWGLTASDGDSGYSAHSPDNDRGVMTPTAALSSMPYTPTESMKALRHFYYILGDRLWGEYGFYDAFNITESWTASSYLAIDQGPIILMIENHRTGLLWDLFMSDPEVKAGLTKLGFSYE